MAWVRQNNISSKREKVWDANGGKDLYTGAGRKIYESERGIEEANSKAFHKDCNAIAYNVKGVEVDHVLECQQVVKIWDSVKDSMRGEMSRSDFNKALAAGQATIYHVHNHEKVNLNNTTAHMNRAKEFAVMDWLQAYNCNDKIPTGVAMIDCLKDHGVNATNRRKIVAVTERSIKNYTAVLDHDEDSAGMLSSFTSELEKITGLLKGL